MNTTATPSIHVSVHWHERNTYRATIELDLPDFIDSLLGQGDYSGRPEGSEKIFAGLPADTPSSQLEQRIRHIMNGEDEGQRRLLKSLLEEYFTDNLPDSSDGSAKHLDGSNSADHVEFV